MQDYQTEHHEQLGGGAAYAAHADDGSGTTVRVVPITEGERTIGHRKNGDEAPAIWDEEPLREAVEQGTLNGTLIVKGEGGSNPHFPMDEQVPPENILGRIERWDYEEGTGPVGYAQLADEDIANRVGLGLLEVSGDWLRRLGEYDQERKGKPVTEIVDLPRVHVIERGAAQGASIEMAPETAEALGYNPDSPEVNEAGAAHAETQEQRSDDGDEGDEGDDGDGDRDGDGDGDGDGSIAQHASEGDAVKWQSSSGGSREPANERYGLVVNPAPDDSDRDWMVAVYQPNSDYDGWEPRDETQPMSDDTLERLGPDGKGSLPAVSNVVEQDASLIDRLASRVADILGGAATGEDVVGVVEQQAEATITTPTYSGTEENSWERPSFEDFDEDFSAARESATIDRTDSGEENFGDLGLFVVSPSSGSLNLAGLRAANSRAPQTNGVSEDQVSQLQTMYARLADEEFDADWGSEQDASGADGAAGVADGTSNDAGEKSAEGNADASVEQHKDVDESAESDTSGADATDNSTMSEDNDLREQLASVKSEKEQLASEKSDLEEQLSEKEEETESLEEQLSEKESTIEEKEERIETLETEVSPLKEMLAEIAAGDSMLDPERIADTHSTEELVDMLADDEDAGDDTASYTDKVKEQLAATFEPRGDAGSEVGEEKNLDEQQAAEVEQLAEKVMTAQDWKASQDYSSNREYIKTTKGVDPANVSSEVELRQKIQNNANADGGE